MRNLSGKSLAADDLQLLDARSEDESFLLEARRQAFRQYLELSGGWDDEEQARLHRERMLIQRFRIVRYKGQAVLT